MSNSGEKSSQINDLDIDPMQRLASFKAPRDLSLGAAKPNKKVFTPNLNVTRNKNKGPSSARSRDHKKDDRSRRDVKNDRNKNFRNVPNIIKSSGVFSEGLGVTERHSYRTSYGRDVEATPKLQKPTIRIKNFVKFDKELEDQMIKSLLGENGDIGEDTTEDFRHVLEEDAPIKLPVDDGGWLQSQTKAAAKHKQEVVVKKEPTDDVDSAVPTVEQNAVPEVKKETVDDTDVVNILRSDKPTLILLQLPDSLPGRGGSFDEDAPRGSKAGTSDASTSNADSNEEKPVDTRCRLSDLEEGRIGKLLVHRSGRVTLALGDTTFEVCSGTKACFQQEVVSVATDDSSRSANIIALGPVQHKLNLVPDWERLFCDMSV